MNENPIPNLVPIVPVAEPAITEKTNDGANNVPLGAIEALLARLAAMKRAKKKVTKGAFGKQRLKDKMAKQRFNDPTKVAVRKARKEERQKIKAKI